MESREEMTIDERLDRLTERHEALTQTVEHMALQGEEQNKRIQLQTANIDRIMNVVEKDRGSGGKPRAADFQAGRPAR